MTSVKNQIFLGPNQNMMIRYILLVFTFTFIGCTGSTTSETAESEATNMLDGLKLKTIDGKDFDKEKLKGKTVFINFWASWCGPCISEMPSIQELQKKVANENIEFLLVSNEHEKQIKNFVDNHDFQMDFARLDMPLEQLEVQGLPTTYIISPDGNIAYSEMGARDWSTEESIKIVKGVTSK